MKLLAATTQTQGQRSNDFCFVPENELVVPPAFQCDSGSVDDKCGCRRSWSGMQGFKATTTMKVIEADLTPGEFEQRVLQYYIDGDWVKPDRRDEWKDRAGEAAYIVMALAKHRPVGTVLEIRENGPQEREAK